MYAIYEIERRRVGGLAIVFCNALGRSSDGPWMPVRVSWYKGEARFADPSGIEIVAPDEWKQATVFEVQEEMERQGVTVAWVEKVSASEGQRVDMLDGTYVIAGPKLHGESLRGQ